MNLTKIFLMWCIMPILGIINGIFRQLVLARYMDEKAARQLSALTLIVLLTLYISAIWKKLHIQNAGSAWKTGLVWTALTVLFEFSLGYFLSGLTWQQMFAEYNVFNGKLWPMVLLTLLAFPPICFRIQQGRKPLIPS